MYTFKMQQQIDLLTALNKDGVGVEWYPDGKWVDIREVPRNVDPEWFGRWLADYFSDWFEVGVDCNDSDNGAWNEIEGMFEPEATFYKTLTGYKATKWWEAVRDAYDGLFEECMQEWKAEMKHGHPSLTAAERNSGGAW
jgi:hypothetical protein